MEMTESLGGLLKGLRSSRRMSQQAAADAAGVARSTLLRWESETFQPRLPELEAMLQALGASPAQRDAALTYIAAPRAIRSLQGGKAEGFSPNASWIFTPGTGDLLRAMRLRSGMTQEQIAVRIGVGPESVSRWESGNLIPSAERLDCLMTMLDARPEERTSLAQGILSLSRLTIEEGARFEDVKAQYDSLCLGFYNGDLRPIGDLDFFRVEKAFVNLASQSRDARHFLVYTYSLHAQWLAQRRRFKEAGQYADRVFEAIHQEPTPSLNWERAIPIAAQAAAYGGDRPRPERGVRMLESWLPLTHGPEFEAWMLSDIAGFLAEMGRLDAALDLAARSCRVAQRCDNPTELRLRRVDHAEILLLTGSPENANRALDLLPSDAQGDPRQQTSESLLWARAFLNVGDPSEAQRWLNRAETVIRANHLDTTTLEALTQRF